MNRKDLSTSWIDGSEGEDAKSLDGRGKRSQEGGRKGLILHSLHWSGKAVLEDRALT